MHTCHATGCAAEVPPEKLMCFRHWKAVPKPLQQAVWRHYREGQCQDKNPSEEWHKAADAAIMYIARKEKKC